MKVVLLDQLGDDLTAVNAARVSFKKVSSELDEKDEKLIRYLATHDHWTPFSHIQYQVRISAPIFVARQWFKHIVGITRNEVSRRYVSDPPEFYMPTSWRSKPENTKQGSDGDLSLSAQMVWDTRLLEIHRDARATYTQMIHEGVAPEQARMILPQTMMTEWVESGSLVAAARIAKLRLDSHSQVEIQELATMFSDTVSGIAPVSWKALT